MFLVSALLVSAGIGAIVGGIEGAQNYEKAQQQRDLIDLQKKAQQAQLERSKATYRQNALDTSSYLTLSTNASAENLDSELSEYENQVNLYASQAQRSVGSANASTAQTGFRRSGSNLNAVKNTQSDVLSQMKSVYSNIQQTRISNGQSLVSTQTNAMSNLAGYRKNVSDAMATTQEQINYLNEQRDQLGYEDLGTSIWKGIGLGAASGTVNYLSGRLSDGDKMFGSGSWAWN